VEELQLDNETRINRAVTALGAGYSDSGAPTHDNRAREVHNTHTVRAHKTHTVLVRLFDQIFLIPSTCRPGFTISGAVDYSERTAYPPQLINRVRNKALLDDYHGNIRRFRQIRDAPVTGNSLDFISSGIDRKQPRFRPMTKHEHDGPPVYAQRVIPRPEDGHGSRLQQRFQGTNALHYELLPEIH
jgi:hypothetical protein